MGACIAGPKDESDWDRKQRESLESIWGANRGERIVLRSKEYETTVEFPKSGRLGDEAEIVVTRLADKRTVFFGPVKPEAPEYGRIKFIFSPTPGSLPHITSEVPKSSPPPRENYRGKFEVEVRPDGQISAAPCDNYGNSGLGFSSTVATSNLEGNLFGRPKTLSELAADDIVGRLAAGIEHTHKGLNCPDIMKVLREQRRRKKPSE